MLHGHGDDGYKYKQAIEANFSSNVWFGNKLEKLKDHLISNWNKINSYPEASAESLVTAISKDLNLSNEEVIVTNGATEAFYLIAHSFKSSSSTIVIPTFAEYEDACTIHNHKLKFVNWQDLQQIRQFKTDLVWICNPNNPTGDTIDKSTLKSILESNLNSILIIDEAYIDFTDVISSSIDLLKTHKNLIIVKSLTKNFSIPGLRLGYLLSSKDIVQNIEFYKAPWSVNSLAIEAGKFLIQHKNEYLPPVTYYKSTTEKFRKKLEQISGFKIVPSKTSFFLIKLEQSNSIELKNYLIREYGMLVRDASNFRGLDSSYIRVSTQTDEKNQLLIEALKKWSSSY